MEFDDQSSSSDGPTVVVPLYATYLNMAIIFITDNIVIIPALMVINVIWQTRELHKKYYFFVANLLATIAANKIVRSFLQYLIMILYLCDMISASVEAVIRWMILPLSTLLYLMIILLPITVAAERLIVVTFPYHYRKIITKKAITIVIVVMWGVAAILTTIITIVVPVKIVWPLALIQWDYMALPIVLIPRIISTVFIIAANIVLQRKVTISNRKAEENKRLGNEEEAKRFTKLVQVFRTQTKATITVFVVGSVDVIANILIPTMYTAFLLSLEPSKRIYYEQFIMHPIQFCLLLSHPVLYGLYIKRIRKRLPITKCTACLRRWIARRNRVGVLQPHPRREDRQLGEQQSGDQPAGDQQPGDQQARDQQAGDRQMRDRHTEDQQGGDQQEGDQEAGDQQEGDQQAGDQQEGDQQEGDQQAGDQQEGDQQAGDQQEGDQQAGDQQEGDQQAGDQQARDQQAGDQQARDQLAGDKQGEDKKPGDQQVGDQRAGDQQAGDYQVGNQQVGDQQAGDQQVGNQQAEGQQMVDRQPRVIIVNVAEYKE